MPEPIALAPNTDAYQPGERQFRLTRRCLEVAAEFKQPIALITKNALVLRDLDILGPMAAEGLVQANVSVTTLDAELARTMEPRTSTPAARLRAIRGLAEAGVPVRVLVAPVIPGLTDTEIPAILAAAREAGAKSAAYTMLRLPLTVAPVFLEWLERCYPDRAARIEGRIRGVRGGRLNSPEFGERMSGDGGDRRARSPACSRPSPPGMGWTAACRPWTAPGSAGRGRPAGSCGCSSARARCAPHLLPAGEAAVLEVKGFFFMRGSFLSRGSCV